ncbi:SCO family protein, partial [Paraburkholderia sp. SIMBA_050]
MSSARPAPHRRHLITRFVRTAAALTAAVALAACTHDEPNWHLTNVTGHLPDL